MSNCSTQTVPRGISTYYVQASDISDGSTFAKLGAIVVNILGSRFEPSKLDKYVRELMGANAEHSMYYATSLVSGDPICIFAPGVLHAGMKLAVPASWESAWPTGTDQEQVGSSANRPRTPITLPGGGENATIPSFSPSFAPQTEPLPPPPEGDGDDGGSQVEQDDESGTPWWILGVATLAIGGTWWMMTRK